MKVIDLTIELSENTPVYPGDKKPDVTRTGKISENGYIDFTLTTGMHTGTHIDGPMHMQEQSPYLSEIDIDQFTGKGILINASGEKIIEWKPEYDGEITADSIVLIYTGHSEKIGKDQYFTDHPVISENFAEKLVSKKIKLLGIDSPSPDYPPYSVHKIFFKSGILIAENLTNLDKLQSYKNFTIAALPLKIRTDSAPARIVAIID